ncbi:MAG: succinate dehydrogenase, hydrophobic membrane anchor protein [Rhodospirillaceae bacterium]|nr:succinate dehydrogenase, hydrophobic membrane anchor protein [Rhodospirillaceae bacterium]
MFAHYNLRTPLGRARGLGSATEGLHHWWAQRLTALALIPLTVWFVAAVVGLAGSDYEQFVNWLSTPYNASAMILFLGVSFHHAQLGMQVVIEDYVGNHGWRIGTIVVVKFICCGLGALGIVSTLIVTFGV